MGRDTVEIVLDFEKEFDIEIPNDIAEQMTTQRHTRDFVVTEYLRLGRLADPEDIFERIRQIAAKFAAMKPGKIELDSRFIEDLKLD